MTLGERLKGFVEGKKREAIAADWHARWEKAGSNRVAKTTAVSQLSRCLNDKREGVEFFFGDAKRAQHLFDALEVPGAGRDELLAMAAEALRADPMRPRIVLYAAEWSMPRSHRPFEDDAASIAREADEEMFKEIKRVFLADASLLPMAIVLTEDQYERVPRSFDDLGDQLQLVAVSRSDAWNEVERLAQAASIVVSNRPLADWRRWLFAHRRHREFEFVPTDGLDRLRRGQPLFPDSVGHDLAEIVANEVQPAVPADDPVVQHRFRAGLGTEDGVAKLQAEFYGHTQWGPERRLAWARALGAPATSTKDEREHWQRSFVRFTVERHGGTWELGDRPNRLSSRLLAAYHRPTANVGIAVAEEFHVLNPTPPLADALRGRTDVKVHVIPARAPAMSRLLSALAEQTVDERSADPFLEKTINNLSSANLERAIYRHAAANLIVSGALPKATTKFVPEWSEILSRTLSRNPPAARLRVSMASGAFAHLPGTGSAASFSFLARPEDATFNEASPLVPPIAPVVISRGDRLAGVTLRPLEYGQGSDVLLTTEKSRGADAALWLALLEGSSALGGFREKEWKSSTSARGVDQRAEMDVPLLPFRWSSRESKLLTFSDGDFDRADRDLALVWMALRRAMAKREVVALPSGGALISMGGALVAEVQPLSRAKDAPSEVGGSIELAYTELWNPKWDQLATIEGAETRGYSTASTRAGPLVPLEVVIEAEGLAAHIRFHASSLLGGVPLNSLTASAAAAAVDESDERDDD